MWIPRAHLSGCASRTVPPLGSTGQGRHAFLTRPCAHRKRFVISGPWRPRTPRPRPSSVSSRGSVAQSERAERRAGRAPGSQQNAGFTGRRRGGQRKGGVRIDTIRTPPSVTDSRPPANRPPEAARVLNPPGATPGPMSPPGVAVSLSSSPHGDTVLPATWTIDVLFFGVRRPPCSARRRARGSRRRRRGQPRQVMPCHPA